MINDTDIACATFVNQVSPGVERRLIELRARPTATATVQSLYYDVTCGYCDRALENLGDRTEICNCL